MQGRTTFMIAHRLSTLRHCDLRLEIEQGRLSGGFSDALAAAGTTQAQESSR